MGILSREPAAVTGFVTDRFRRALDHLFELEGGFVDDPADGGGKTKYGISQRAYPTLDIRRLTRDDAAQLYHRDYWCKLKLDDLLDEPLAAAVFDMGVNAGIGTAAKLLQRAINALGRPISVDGRIGPATLALANLGQPERLRAAFRRACRHYYEDIVARNPSQRVFLKGWLNRIGDPQP